MRQTNLEPLEFTKSSKTGQTHVECNAKIYNNVIPFWLCVYFYDNKML